MTQPFAALAAQAAALAPMSNGEVATVPGRLLLADGDGLCYYCAGNDETEPGQARRNLIDKLRSAARACGASTIRILVTGRGSHKGFRYAIARVKKYQGQREGSRRPKNWEYLRSILECRELPTDIEVEFTDTAEADDLFSRFALGHPDCVIYTQDKDMRMVNGWHLDWVSHILFRVDSWSHDHNEKVWGRAWFWQQLLMGDTADNIPGLPWYLDGLGVQKRIGEVGAKKALAQVSSDMGALLECQKLYRSYYKGRWLVEMLEQGILLWMRTDTGSSPFNVTAPGNPFEKLTTHEFWPAARTEILQRIAEAMVHEEAQGERDSGGEGDVAAEERHAVCALLAPTDGGEGGAGSLPLDGCDSGQPAQRVQCAAGEGGERVSPVRGEEPVRIPAWVRCVLAKA